MPSLRTLLRAVGLGSLTQAPIQVHPESSTSSLLREHLTNSPHYANDSPSPYRLADSCPFDGPLSCHNSTAIPEEERCCFIYPSGQLLLTQFWDAEPAVGPKDSWTLHGLWPDLCDGRYKSFCNEAPRYNNITDILIQHGETDLLETMLQYWLPDRGTPESFWAHEWNKHGTCVNTLSPSCYASESTTSHDSFDSTKQPAELKRRSLDEGYKHGQEVVDYLLTAISLFDRLDTYTALTNADIYPSKTRHYTHREVSAALEKVTGKPVILGCKRGELNEVWYTFNVRGSLQGGVFEAADPAGAGGKGTCGRNVRWLPKV